MKIFTDGSHLKRFLIVFSPTAFLLILISSYLYQLEASYRILLVEGHERQELEKYRKIINHKLETARSDLIFLAAQTKIWTAGDGDSSETQRALQRYFLKFSKCKAVYDRVCFLDATGMETVKVGKNLDKPFVAASDNLRFEGGNSYFKEVFRLPPEHIVISPLKPEDGWAENFSAVMKYRIGIPVVDSGGNRRGVIFIDYSGKDIVPTYDGLPCIPTTLQSRFGSDSYWLRKTNVADKWRVSVVDDRDLRNASFQNHFSDAWPLVVGSERFGQFQSQSGLFTFGVLSPFEENSKVIEMMLDGSPSSQPYCRKLVFHVSPEALAGDLAPLRTRYSLIGSGLVLVMGGVIWLLTGIYTKHERVKNKLEISREQLQRALDSVDAMIYVTDMDSYEILFTNQYVKDHFGDVVGTRCWETIQKGQDGPCEFCQFDRIRAEGQSAFWGSHIWEVKNTKNGEWYECRDNALLWLDGRPARIQIATNISERIRYEKEHEKITAELSGALAEIKTLRDILPICSFCKRIRNDDGYYEQLEGYFHKCSGVDFSHGVCPACMKEHYPEEYQAIKECKRENADQ